MGDPKGYCINLDSRPDKWKNTEAIFAGSGIHLQRFSAIQRAEGWRGCGASHVGIAHEALRQGLPWVIVVEDDCIIGSDFAKRWPVVMEALKGDRDWDIFLGGPTYLQGPIDIREPLIEVERGFALHFYVLKACAYERAIAWNPDRHGPIDVYYSDQFRILTTYPILAIQDASISDIKHKEVNYMDHFHETDEILQKLIYSAETREGTLLLLVLSAAILLYTLP